MTGSAPLSLNTRVQFAFTTDDPSSTTFCQLDGSPWESCSSPKVYGFVGDGVHDFRTKAMDPVGNIGSVNLTKFTVATNPGDAAITLGPSEGETASSRPSFGFEAAYSASFECRLDGADWAACSDGGTHTPESPLIDGQHVFEVRGVGGTGKLGNPARRSFIVDATPPSLSIDPPRRASRSPVFTVRADDPAGIGVILCRVDSAQFAPCSAKIKVRKPPKGKHTLEVKATDGVGNQGEATAKWRQSSR